MAVIDGMGTGNDQVCIAFAGSGKTGTGVEVAHRLRKQGLVLLFNRAARQEVSPRLPGLVQAFTSHALAFQHVIETSDGYAQKIAGQLDPDNVPRLTGPLIAQELRLKSTSDPDIPSVSQLTMAILKTIEAFQTSADNAPGPEHVPEDVLPLHLRQPDRAEDADELKERLAVRAQKLWRLMASEHNGFPITHDTYLKIFQLRGTRVQSDLWILDEYQDTAPVVEAMVQRQSGQKLYIGDPYQQIYGWRGAINALSEPIRRGAEVHYLTDSFRYNHQIAGLATLILRALGETHPVRGQARELLQFDFRSSHTVICRSNLTILVRAGEALLDQRHIQIEGGLPSATFARVESALALFEGRFDDVKVGTMRAAGSWAALVDQVNGLGDRAGDARTLMELVERYQSHLPLLLSSVRRAASIKGKKTNETIHFITAHKSKGREFPMVALDGDLAPPPAVLTKLQNDIPLSSSEQESLHVLYVALTRAELAIHLPASLKAVFGELSKLFGQTLDTSQHLADVQVPEPEAYRAAVRRLRTQEFIRQHRSPD